MDQMVRCKIWHRVSNTLHAEVLLSRARGKLLFYLLGQNDTETQNLSISGWKKSVPCLYVRYSEPVVIAE